ncbi:MAG TPA: cytochrome P450 [Burkholderiaceae bacterium]|nr:cytochrome P450 [Burkholderiaceae bacterium]
MSVEAVANVEKPVRQIRNLPGPWGLPVIGNALQFRRESMHLQLERWAREFGEVFQFRVALSRFVVFSNPDTVAAILRNRPEVFWRRARLEETARQYGFGGLFSSNGEDWKRQRSMVLNGLDPSHVKAFFPTLLKVTDRLAHRWQIASQANAPIDLQSDLMRYTVDVTAGLAFGTDINTLESHGEVIQTHLDKILPAVFRRLFSTFPYWRFIKLPGDRVLEGHLLELRRAVADFIAQARQRLDQNPERREHPANLIEAMVAERDRKGSALTDGDVSGNVLTMLLAGEDTTANTLAWLIWLLSKNPQALQRAVEEARRTCAGDRPLQHQTQLAELEYIEACAHEAMRLKPVGPFIVLQTARDTVAGQVALPAGTLVLLLMRPAAVDERYFPEPQAFRPERWLAQGASTGTFASAKRIAMPFGAGPRMCPGRYLALAEIKMVMAMLLACFDIDNVSTPDGSEAREKLALTMSPVGLQLHLRSRQ